MGRWCLGGVSVVSRWCLGGLLVVSWWCLGGVSVLTPSRQHHQQNTIINTPSTQHHQHYTIYTTSSKRTSSTRHHQQHRGPGKSARLNTVDARCVCVAGAALRAPQSHFAWQAQHLEHLSLISRGKCSTWSTSRDVCGSPARIE